MPEVAAWQNRSLEAVYPNSQVPHCIVRQFRQITKNKPSFTNNDSLCKMLYLASRKIVEHWTARCRNWDMVLAQLQLMFQDRQAA